MEDGSRVAWPLSLKQTASLLKHRCTLISCHAKVDTAELCSGDPAGAMSILRFLFAGFSQGLTEFLEAEGYAFTYEMSDFQLAKGVLAAWPLLSERPIVASVTPDKLLSSKRVADRLLFALQCVIVCTDKACELADIAGLVGTGTSSLGSERSSKGAQAVFSHTSSLRTPPLAASDSMRDTMQWMAQVYREQLKTIDGAAQQEAWVQALRDADVAGSNHVHVDLDLPSAGGGAGPLLNAQDQALYRAQLSHNGTELRSGPESDAGARALQEKYAAGMKRLDLVGINGGLEENMHDGARDARLETPFMGD